MFQVLASLLAFFYGLVPSYAVAITLLTLAVMLVLSPLTIKSTRNMLEMSRIQPEIKKIQEKYKNDRQKLNEETMAFYKEHKVNPVAGCIPMILQMPVFIVMYRVIAGLTHHTKEGLPDPKYLSKDTDLYKALVHDGGKMVSFGLDLAKSASVHHPSFVTALPFFVLVALVMLTQYFQTKQMTARNPAAAQANPQAQTMTRVMPIFFGFISYSIPAGVNVYFLSSALFRIVQQEAMYRFDPHVVRHVEASKNASTKTIETKSKDVTKPDDKAKNNGNGSGPKGDKPGQLPPKASQNKRKKRGR
ncbi:MAG: YidC/Oxa1 family rane protein insertase [Acidimicrobiaceae bacterium]|nr:YidC/Oxa1 family rane protein insertase [Acidimicrobiaceae bacterium]MDQ1443725.1 YidC/Oxa1 family rane protein insertase [Acidimicrobiaceae bacterium]